MCGENYGEMDSVEEEVEMKPVLEGVADERFSPGGAYRVCCVSGCSNTSQSEAGKARKFYDFPNPHLWRDHREKWVYFVRISRQASGRNPEVNWEPSGTSFICCDHFIGGVRSEDPSEHNFNPTILNPRSAKDTNHSENPVTGAETEETLEKVICTICTSQSSPMSTVQSYLLNPKFTKFCSQILNSDLETNHLIHAFKSFGSLSVCESCLAMISAAAHQDAEMNLVEHHVQKLQLQLLKELRYLQKLVAGYCEQMNEIKTVIDTSDVDLLHANLGGEKYKEILKFRTTVVKKTESIHKTSEWLGNKVTRDGNQTTHAENCVSNAEIGEEIEIGEIQMKFVDSPHTSIPLPTLDPEHFILPDLNQPSSSAGILHEAGQEGESVIDNFSESNHQDDLFPVIVATRSEALRSGKARDNVGDKDGQRRKRGACGTCGKDLTSLNNRTRHRTTCALKASKLKFSCDKCPATFSRKDNMTQHKLKACPATCKGKKLRSAR